MKVKLSKWGNSLAVRIPAPLAERIGLEEGAALEIYDEGDTLTLSQVREEPTFKELVSKITENNIHKELDWGTPVGNEK
ncbi:MAG: AbrB/MazE/SpoVT family DNA-binding domain-containing protein [Verrucomicrobiota bacterium]